MPDSTLSALPAASALGGTELLYGVQSAADVKVTPAQMATYVKGNFAPLVISTNTVEQRNSTTAQTSQIYNTFTDASNYERLAIKWVSNSADIQTENAGTGSARQVRFLSQDGNNYVGVNNTGVFISLGAGSAVYGRSDGFWPASNMPLGKSGSVWSQMWANVHMASAPVTQTGTTYTIAASDSFVTINAAGTCTVTLPTASSFTGRLLTIRTIAAQAVNSASSNVVPQNSNTAGTAILAATAGKWARLVSDGTNWIIMESN